jgi:hypothetical protein
MASRKDVVNISTLSPICTRCDRGPVAVRTKTGHSLLNKDLPGTEWTEPRGGQKNKKIGQQLIKQQKEKHETK